MAIGVKHLLRGRRVMVTQDGAESFGEAPDVGVVECSPGC